MTQNLDLTMELSLIEEAEMQIIMEDYASQDQPEAFDEPFVEDCEEAIVEDFEEPIIEDSDDWGNLEIYDDDELNDYLARKNRQDNDEEDEWDDEFEYYNENSTSDWTEEDAWWALTDGMYGEMPRNPIAYDAAMDAMGF
ncbi:MAG: hypothetical protein IJJ94_00190 [Bacteroidaceae bacterium]|nr:hypothetical protein [Bacteroidaceae bacterium]